MKRFLAQAYIWILLALLYAPIFFIAVYSFTESKVLGNWTGFSTQLYVNMLTAENVSGGSSLVSAVENTLIIAIAAALFSTLLGTIAAIGIFNLHGHKKQTMQMLNIYADFCSDKS